MFTKDPSRPGGGVFVAREKPSDDLVRELPEGTIVSATGETITAAVSNVRTPNDDVSMSLPADASSSSSPATAGPTYGGNNNWSWSSTSGHAHSGSTTASPQQQQQQHSQQQASSSTAPMVNLTPLGGNGSGGNNYQNMNPALNTAVSGNPENVQILNMLDYAPQGTPVQSFQVTDQVTDPGFFTSIPANMYDYSELSHICQRGVRHTRKYGLLIVLNRSMGNLLLEIWVELPLAAKPAADGSAAGSTAAVFPPAILSTIWRIDRRWNGEWDVISYHQAFFYTVNDFFSSPPFVPFL